MSSVEIAPASLYEDPAYLLAAAAAAGAAVTVAESDGTLLPLLACPDGIMRTVPGLPRPYGPNVPCGLGELARELTEPGVRIAVVLSPLPWGSDLARELSVRGARLIGERQICVTRLDGEDPALSFDPDTQDRIATARESSDVTIGQLESWFSAFQRSATGGPSIAHVDVLSDAQLDALAALEHYVVSVRDEHGVAAAALFLHDATESYCHTGSIRAEPLTDTDVVRLLLAAGAREAARLGCAVAVLGGGRSDRLDDPLLALKRGLATTCLPRFTLITSADA